MARWRIKNICLSVIVTVAGFRAELSFIPFRWARPAYRNPRDNSFMFDRYGYQIFCGPFHFWTMSGNRENFAFEVALTQDVFHGGPIVPRVK